MKTKLKAITAALLIGASAIFISACSAAGGGAASTASSGVKPYRSDVCLVTDNDLGSMGDEQRIVYQGQELKFCCTPCINKFKKSPEKYLQKLQS